jgi:hypothetical protein
MAGWCHIPWWKLIDQCCPQQSRCCLHERRNLAFSKSQPNDEGQKTGGDYSNCDARHLGKPLPNQQIGFGLLRRGVFPARDTSSYCRFAIIKIVRVRWNLAGPVFSGLLNQAFHPELMRI